MNDTYINYIDQLLDLAERNDIFCLTSRAFNEFEVEVRETMEKGKPMKPIKDKYGNSDCPVCNAYVEFSGNQSYYKHEYCSGCGQAIDWGVGND